MKRTTRTLASTSAFPIPHSAFRPLASVLALALLLPGSAAQAVTIDWVTVGNPGNANDVSLGGNPAAGAVAYTYRISKTEVTNAQYAEFLNAVDANGTNPNSVYNTSMDPDTGDARGGIKLVSGNSPGSKYVVASGRGSNPVVLVSFYDSLRFANWLHNGQGSGDTETGAYTITPAGISANNIARNGGATVFLPSENEWYKAAYHDKTAGTAGTYFLYPTGTNSTPNSDQPPGALAIQSNAGNFFRNVPADIGYNDGYAVSGSTSFVSSTNYLTDVGAYTDSLSPYGTFDQGGNVWEWNEAIIGSSRGLRGGSWVNDSTLLAASFRSDLSGDPSFEFNFVGFRVASLFSETAPVPEPESVTLLGIGAMVFVLCCRRRFQKSTL